MFDMGITATESKAMKREWQDNLVRYLGGPQTVPSLPSGVEYWRSLKFVLVLMSV
jgi:hypothetical protein